MTLPKLLRRILWRIFVDLCLVLTFFVFMGWLAYAYVAIRWEDFRAKH